MALHSMAYARDTAGVMAALQGHSPGTQARLLAAHKGKLMRIACKTDNADLVDLLVATPPDANNEAAALEAMHTACTHGLVAAARHGRLPIVRTLCSLEDEHGCPLANVAGVPGAARPFQPLLAAARHGHTAVLQELCSTVRAGLEECLSLCLAEAVRCNQPDVVAWLAPACGARSPAVHAGLLATAAAHGDAGTALVRQLLHSFPGLGAVGTPTRAAAHAQALQAAARAGSARMLAMLRTALPHCRASVLDAAIDSGAEDIVRAELAAGAPVTRSQARAACTHGVAHVVLPAWQPRGDDVQWLIERTHSAEGIALALQLWPHAPADLGSESQGQPHSHAGEALADQLTSVREDCLPPPAAVDALLAGFDGTAREVSPLWAGAPEQHPNLCALRAIARVLCRCYGAPQMRAFWERLPQGAPRRAVRSILFELHTVVERRAPSGPGSDVQLAALQELLRELLVSSD